LAAPPLTHHDIVALVEPFARRGRHVDLAASQRHERRLVFKPPIREINQGQHELHETLQLDCPAGGSYRLTRTLTHPEGVQASLRAQGRELGALLAAVEAVPADRHFVVGPGFTITRSYTLNLATGGSVGALILTQGTVRVDGLALTLNVPAVRRVAAAVTLEPTSSASFALPEDFLAVLGWNWARLVPRKQGWTSKLRLRGSPVQRTRSAEAALDRAAAHLARTLADPPAHYHERLRMARWGVFFRRGIPTFTALALFGTVPLFARFRDALPTPVWLALYHVPTLFVAVSFILQELPRFEIPPFPRRLNASGWRQHPSAPPASRDGPVDAERHPQRTVT